MIRFKAKPDETPAAPAGKAAKPAASKAKAPSTAASASPEKDLLDLEPKHADGRD
jgi:hypothetical protein